MFHLCKIPARDKRKLKIGLATYPHSTNKDIFDAANVPGLSRTRKINARP